MNEQEMRASLAKTQQEMRDSAIAFNNYHSGRHSVAESVRTWIREHEYETTLGESVVASDDLLSWLDDLVPPS